MTMFPNPYVENLTSLSRSEGLSSHDPRHASITQSSPTLPTMALPDIPTSHSVHFRNQCSFPAGVRHQGNHQRAMETNASSSASKSSQIFPDASPKNVETLSTPTPSYLPNRGLPSNLSEELRSLNSARLLESSASLSLFPHHNYDYQQSLLLAHAQANVHAHAHAHAHAYAQAHATKSVEPNANALLFDSWKRFPTTHDSSAIRVTTTSGRVSSSAVSSGAISSGSAERRLLTTGLPRSAASVKALTDLAKLRPDLVEHFRRILEMEEVRRAERRRAKEERRGREREKEREERRRGREEGRGRGGGGSGGEVVEERRSEERKRRRSRSPERRRRRGKLAAMLLKDNGVENGVAPKNGVENGMEMLLRDNGVENGAARENGVENGMEETQRFEKGKEMVEFPDGKQGSDHTSGKER